jgi:SAM-dependent MidA family methyltransferase
VTPFATRLRETIALEGPISVERYMTLCNRHYYGSRDPFGAKGDFTTAPEISQIFGELIGLWAAEVWAAMGRPAPLRLVELGPGRGTLIADALRAARLVPAFVNALTLHLVETSAVLRRAQERTLQAAPAMPEWHETIEDIPGGPAIVVANEFFDALPLRQFVATDRGWCERLVGLDGEGLAFGLRPLAETGLDRSPAAGAVLEAPGAAIALTERLSHRLAAAGGAALIIDYGDWGLPLRDTLQAVKGHAFADPLAEPGEADLTAHVDFKALARAARAEGLVVHGPATQGAFLEALGIAARAVALTRRATPAQAKDIESAVERLTGRGPAGMGALFKVLGLSHPDLAALPGLSLATALEPE